MVSYSETLRNELAADKRRQRYLEAKEKINQAFKQIRKHGIVARQNFMCCCGCASAALGIQTEKWNKTHKKQKIGICFYHQQSNDRFKDGRDLYLYFGSIEDSDNKTVEIGKLIVEELEKAGLEVEWNNSARTSICVKLER